MKQLFKVFYRIDPALFFVFAALASGALYYCLRPPMQSPDEFNHFARAYQISEGKFLPEKKDQRLGGEVPVCFNYFLSLYMPSTFVRDYKLSRKELKAGFDIPFSAEEKVFRDFPNTSFYSPVSYLPQASALFVLRQFSCSVGFMYHVSRLFVFLVWVLCLYFVIRIIPVYKWLFAALILLPMHMYLATSYSADLVTNVLSFMLIALVLKQVYSGRRLSISGIAVLFIVCILLALSKTIYVSLLLLLLCFPLSAFRSRTYKYLVLGAVFIASFSAAYLWSGTIMEYFIPYDEYNPAYRIHATIHEGVDYQKQKEYLATHGTHFFEVLYNTTVKTADFYLRSYIGQFGTYMDTPVADWFCITAYIILVILAFSEKDELAISPWIKRIFFITGISAFSLVILSQHLIWNSVGKDIADSIQGRYLIPVLPLVFLLFQNRWKPLKFNVAPLVVLFVLVSNVYIGQILYTRYFKESYLSRADFTCDIESITSGQLKTSDPHIFLKGGAKRTTMQSRTGKYALLLPPDSSIAAEYAFKNLRHGDLVEIYAWQKGNSKGEIVVEGHGSGCEPFHFINTDIQLKEKTGWKKMQMIFNMFIACDSSEVRFFLQNTSLDTVYFDDLRYSVKRFR